MRERIVRVLRIMLSETRSHILDTDPSILEGRTGNEGTGRVGGGGGLLAGTPGAQQNGQVERVDRTVTVSIQARARLARIARSPESQ